MARKHRKADRNAMARADMENIKDAKDRIKHNEEIFKDNEEAIPELEQMLIDLKEAFEHENAGDNIKLAGLKVIEPRFEFEQSDAWKKWNEEDIKINMRKREKDFNKTIKNVEETLQKRKEQNERITKENEELSEKISKGSNDSDSYIG